MGVCGKLMGESLTSARRKRQCTLTISRLSSVLIDKSLCRRCRAHASQGHFSHFPPVLDPRQALFSRLGSM